ncbi:hypothetical protein V6N11_060251 [Hibiscus sabdariffa]|uniref:Zinc finger, CCHC-type n=1 Tax=Hibiscus sabdariffa TaxID=183260 RepID=A0ABR2QPS1_9ROSI
MANNNLSLRSLLEKEKMNGINFLDWFRNLRIVLKQERKEYVIEEPVPDEPIANAHRADKDKFKKHLDDMLDVSCLMLATMSPELQKQHEDMNAYNMIQNLKEIYEGDLKNNGSKSILMVREAKGKKKAKSKGNGKSKTKGKDALKPEKGISKKDKCFYFERSGHWKRNCPLYLEEVKKSKANRASSSGTTKEKDSG